MINDSHRKVLHMPKLTENLPSRVRKLSKPSNAQQAFQPVLEAISNAVMAVDEAHDDSRTGTVSVQISRLGSPTVEITVRDNGTGLDEAHFAAFMQIDTEYKKSKGGKGVGRLYWLDAFGSIYVESRYKDPSGAYQMRAFDFSLNDGEQINFRQASQVWEPDETGTIVHFHGLRTNAYETHFPKQGAMVITHTASEFIATFLGSKSPTVSIRVETESRHEHEALFPKGVADFVKKGPVDLGLLDLGERGAFCASAFLLDKKASRGMSLKHAVHLLGNGRTVESRKIDDLLGIKEFSTDEEGDLRLHILVESDYLDQRTVESRTAFSIPEGDLAEITREVVSRAREGFLKDQFATWDASRRAAFSAFLENQPIYAFSDVDNLFNDVLPPSASTPDDFVRSLSVIRIRRENEREKRLGELVGTLVSGDKLPKDFEHLVQTAAREIQTNEKAALAHHAARRKVVLDLLDRLVRRLRTVNEESADTYHLEKTLHTMLVPMQVQGNDLQAVERAGHDLWLLDERLTFTAGFSSDIRLRKTVKGSNSDDRPDVLIWDIGYGLGPIDEANGEDDIDDHLPLSQVFIVELKKPGRTNYGPNDRLEDQLTKYIREIKKGTIESFGRRNIRVSPDCRFYCLAVADINAQLLENELANWDSIDNERGRRREISNLKAVIEVVGWSDVLASAKERNRALLSIAGLQMRATTAFENAPDMQDKTVNRDDGMSLI